MIWVKAFHVIAMVAWFAGLFYLPRLFVYHASCSDLPGRERFKVMERKLIFIIMTPAALITTLLGFWMLFEYAWAAYRSQGWLHAKLFLVALLWIFHFYCVKLADDFRKDRSQKSEKFFRVLNELPTLLLVGIVVLVIVKPF